MECRAYCTAANYQIKPLYEMLKNQVKATFYRDVIHLSIPLGERNGDVFYFSYGVTVCWGLSLEGCEHYLATVRPFEDQRLDEFETDQFQYSLGVAPIIIEDEIILPSLDELSLLAVSHGIAQSVKLGTFENTVRKTYDNMKHIPEHLAKYGRIPLSRQEIRRKMGELFLERNSINLHVDVLDTPEFFWNFSELEAIYKMTANYLDIKTRVEVLNHRLNVVHELFEMLGNELKHQHSSRLEWTIIGLIVLEVILTLLRDVFKWI